MSNRNVIKWQPFAAVISGTSMINDVLKEKNKIQMPLLSEDQKQELQEKMVTFFQTQEVTTIKFYRDGKLYLLKGKITSIDPYHQKIIVNAQHSLFFSQIIAFF